MPDNKKQTAIIFGGAGGIGKILSEHLANTKGYGVSVVSRNEADIIADITNEDAVKNAFALHRERFKEVPSVVINAAAIQKPIGRSWEVDSLLFKKNIEVNLLGNFYIVKEAINNFKSENRNENKNGHIILFSGGGAVFARENFLGYSLSKTAVVRMVENVSEELREAGINNIFINAIAPGAVKTQMTEEVFKSSVESAGDKAIREATEIMKSGGTDPKLITNLFDFLLSADVDRKLLLSGRLIHVKEPYLEWVQGVNSNNNSNNNNNNNNKDIGKLRRVSIC
ncbi:MAG: SDR family oxidoreductase [Oligoflexia bacterium]|nr:SDR family oxidoreductase [Oligoflexia bacterium]